MATYYRWNQYRFTDEQEYSFNISPSNIYYTTKYLLDIPMPDAQWQLETGPISAPHTFQNVRSTIGSGPLASAVFFSGGVNGTLYVSERGEITSSTDVVVKRGHRFLDYVYSTNPNAYTSDIAISNTYVYAYKTIIQSPLPPASLNYPNSIVAPKVEISWPDSITNVPIYKVKLYEISYSTDNGTSWNIAGTTSQISYSFLIPTETFSIRFRVRAQDSNNKWSDYVVGNNSTVYWLSTLTVPILAMQGQQATVSWTAIEGADSYTLQRKANTDADWTQVYSGTALTFSETVGTWTSLQYRVQAVFDGTSGGWATSNSIQIVSASSLVISGQDGDLGTLTSDVPYSISSDQTSPTIDVTVEVNGGEYASFQATSGQTYKVSVLDLPTGTGNITITATTEVSSSPVTVTRTWTYSKTAQTFPNSGSVAALTKEGNVVYPETLPEAVRTSMTPWGGNLSTALNLLKNAALFNRTKQPKYSEVTVSMTNVTEGQIVNIPRGGVMVPHYVGKLEYESGLNGAGRRLLVPVNCYDERLWGPSSVNAWAGSTLLSWENSDYKALFPEEIQTAMGTTTYYYTPGNGNKIVTTRADAVFSLSMTELGFSGDQMNVEGSPLPIANTLRFSGQLQSTRSPRTNGTANVWCVSGTGAQDAQDSGSLAWSRPVFTLPSTFTYGPVYVDNQGTIHNQQEYTEAGNWLDVWGNAIPAVKIETGSYVGTGTYGQINPTIITASFTPKIVFIMADSGVNTYPADWFIRGTLQINLLSRTSGNAVISLAWDEFSVKLIATSNAEPQFNKSGVTYRYIIIG